MKPRILGSPIVYFAEAPKSRLRHWLEIGAGAVLIVINVYVVCWVILVLAAPR